MKSTLETTYRVSLRIAKMCKPHTVAENLILPAAIGVVEAVIGSEDARNLKANLLSNNTVSRRIDEMAGDGREQLIQKIKESDCCNSV
jgi:hypothetical protein